MSIATKVLKAGALIVGVPITMIFGAAVYVAATTDDLQESPAQEQTPAPIQPEAQPTTPRTESTKAQRPAPQLVNTQASEPAQEIDRSGMVYNRHASYGCRWVSDVERFDALWHAGRLDTALRTTSCVMMPAGTYVVPVASIGSFQQIIWEEGRRTHDLWVVKGAFRYPD